MTKVLENGRTEITISVEKEQGKNDSIDLWKKNGFPVRKFLISLWRK